MGDTPAWMRDALRRAQGLGQSLAQALDRAKPENVRAATRLKLDQAVAELTTVHLSRTQPETLPFPGMAAEDRIALQVKIEQAIRRNAAVTAKSSKVSEWYGNFAVTPLSLISFLVGLAAGKIPFFVAFAVYGALGFAPIFFHRISELLSSRILEIIATGLLLALFLIIPNIFLLTYWIDSSTTILSSFAIHVGTEIDRAGSVSNGLLYFAIWLDILLLISSSTIWLDSCIRKRSHAQDETSGPYDFAIFVWSQTVRKLVSAAPEWPTRQQMVDIYRHMSSLSYVVERELQIPWLRDSNYARLTQVNIEASRVSLCIRQNRDFALQCGTGEEFSRVIDSLSDGLAALTIGSREQLLANAPEVTRRSLLKEFAKRAYPGLVLLSAGLLLPLIPQMAEQGEMAANARIALVVMGVLALASTPADAAQKVNEIIAKAFPLGKQ